MQQSRQNALWHNIRS